MPGHPLPTGSKPLPEDPEGPFPQAALVVRAQRLHQARPVAVLPDARLRATVVRSADSVWALLKLAAHASLALRLCHDPGGIAKVRRLAANGALKIAAEGSLGRYDILVSVCGEGTPILHCVTTFTPARAVLLAAGSRDLFPLPGTGDPTVVQGKVHSTQKGCEAGFAFFTVTQPEGGSAFYLQNFSALNDYWEATGTEPKESVGAEWPELGFRRPVSDAKPLAAGRRYVISDSYLVTDPRMPNKEYGIADMFLEALAKVYLVLPRPKAAYYDWPGAAKLTLRALNRCRPCQRHIKGRLYFNAYVGSSYKPPESMVHCALLVPLLEYVRWVERKVPLADRMMRGLPVFYDPRPQTVVRWLPGVKFRKEKLSEEEHNEVMDSWYLVHTVHNLGRLVEMGHREFHELYFKSVAYLMKAAAHFDHCWPVFYNVFTLQTLKEESEPGAGGEQDVPGLYVHVMVQAYEISQDHAFLKEAESAAARLNDLGMGLLYQTNNTVMSAVALAMLWKHTSDRHYLDLSRLCLANAASRLWLWDLDVGSSKHYTTFMALPPLHNAPYISPYEEAEVFGSFCKYLEVVGPEITEPLSIFISEYQRYLLHRACFYYPTALPAEILSSKVREGFIAPQLPIPLEDLYPVSEKAGQVGQEVYGAACPLILLTRAYIRLKGMPFLFFCNYPILQHSFRKDDREGLLVVHIGGSDKLACCVRCLQIKARKGAKSPEIACYLAEHEPWREVSGRTIDAETLEYEVSGATRIAVTWKSLKRSSA